MAASTRSVYAQIASETKEIHQKVENLPYLQRYKTNAVTLRDHYRHLRQLFEIYAYLEKALESCRGIFNDKFLEQSKKIEQDLAFLSDYVRESDKDTLLPETETYLKQLDQLFQAGDLEKLFGHFALRILADTHGGISQTNHVRSLYVNYSVPLEGGVNFYSFTNVDKQEFIRVLNDMKYENRDKVVMGAKAGFQAHADIFSALERTRTIKSYWQFFTLRNVALTATAAVVAVAACTMG